MDFITIKDTLLHSIVFGCKDNVDVSLMQYTIYSNMIYKVALSIMGSLRDEM